MGLVPSSGTDKLFMMDAVRELWDSKSRNTRLWVLKGENTPVRVGIIAVSIFGITALHHLTPIEMLHWHNIFQHLCYLPIVVAALSFGWRGGLIAAIASGLSQTP